MATPDVRQRLELLAYLNNNSISLADLVISTLTHIREHGLATELVHAIKDLRGILIRTGELVEARSFMTALSSSQE